MKDLVRIYFGLLQIQVKYKINFKARDFNATSLSTYGFSTLYTTLPHYVINDKLIDLLERTFHREGCLYHACNDRKAFFTSEKP